MRTNVFRAALPVIGGVALAAVIGAAGPAGAQADPPGDNGTVAHAQLSFGNGMIMLGSAENESPFGRLMKQPSEAAGANTQSVYVVVTDADALYDRAKQAGARIAMEIRDEGYGGRAFACHDLEGHLWSVGTYDPCQPRSA